MRALFIIFFLFGIISKIHSQILFNKTGNAVAHIENGSIYKIDGTPVAYIENDIVYQFDGKLIGWWSKGIFYDRDGYVYLFVENAISNVITKPAPILGIRKILPIKKIKEIPPIRPLFKNTFSNSEFIFENSNSSVQTPVANYNPNYYELPTYQPVDMSLTYGVLQEAQRRNDNLLQQIKFIIDTERKKSDLGQRHIRYFQVNKQSFLFNVTVSNTFTKKAQNEIIKLKNKRQYFINFKIEGQEVFLSGYLGKKKPFSKKFKYSRYIYGHIFLSFNQTSSGFEGKLINIYDGSLSNVRYDRFANEMVFTEKNTVAILKNIK